MNECNEDAFRHENMSFNGRTSLVPVLKKKTKTKAMSKQGNDARTLPWFL